MTLFSLVAGAMLVVALAMLLGPLLRRAPQLAHNDEARAATLDAHRKQAHALRRQLEHGALDDDGFAQAMEELERDVLHDASATTATPKRQGRSWYAALLIALVLPTATVMLYQQLGTPQAIAVLDDPQHMAQLANASPPSHEQLERMAQNLSFKLNREGGDASAWQLLARTRMALGHYQQAVQAWERVLEIASSNPEWLIESVEALSMANDMRFPAIAMERIENALRQSPEHPKGLMLGALAALQRGDSELGLRRLKTLRDMHPEQSQQRQFLEQLIARVSQPAPPQDKAAVPVAVQVEIAIAPSLAQDIKPGQRAFVFARRASGPPMPVAAIEIAAESLPTTVVLDHHAHLVEGIELGNVGPIVIGARVSTGASATPMSGDLEGFSGVIDPRSTSHAQVVIDTRRP